MYEDEPDVDHIERTRFPRQRIGGDVELLKLKVGGNWATVVVERRARVDKKESVWGPPVTHRGNIGLMSTAVTWALGNFSAVSIALLNHNGSILHIRT